MSRPPTIVILNLNSPPKLLEVGGEEFLSSRPCWNARMASTDRPLPEISVLLVGEPEGTRTTPRGGGVCRVPALPGPR